MRLAQACTSATGGSHGLSVAPRLQPSRGGALTFTSVFLTLSHRYFLHVHNCISHTFTSVLLKLWLLYFLNFYICISKTYLFFFSEGLKILWIMVFALAALLSITLFRCMHWKRDVFCPFCLLSFFHCLPVHMRCRKWYPHYINVFLAKPLSLLGIGLLTWQLGERRRRGVEVHK